MKDKFAAARLYVITCPPKEGSPGYVPLVEAACLGGADIIQFRDKQMPAGERYETAVRLRAICARHGALFIVNDALDLALAAGADGVHLGQEDLPLQAARQIVHRMGASHFLIGVSTHDLAQAIVAESGGADYVAIGPVFATPTKPDAMPVGLAGVRQIATRIQLPHVAIGGIDASNIEQVLAAGAQRVAVVRAVCGAADVRKAAEQLKQILAQAKC